MPKIRVKFEVLVDAVNVDIGQKFENIWDLKEYLQECAVESLGPYDILISDKDISIIAKDIGIE
jgi:hypothetical protein